LPRYRIGNGAYEFGWRIRPYRTSEWRPQDLARERFTIGATRRR